MINDISLISALIIDKFENLSVENCQIRVKLPNGIPWRFRYIAYRNSWIGWIDGLEVRTLAGRINMSDPDSLAKLDKLVNECTDFINDWHARYPHRRMMAADAIDHFGLME